MKTITPVLKVWQALAILCAARDSYRTLLMDRDIIFNPGIVIQKFEKRAKSILRQIGMKKSEINAPYPDRCINELFELVTDPIELNRRVKKEYLWMTQRN